MILGASAMYGMSKQSWSSGYHYTGYWPTSSDVDIRCFYCVSIYARAVLAVIILSVCPSIRLSDAWSVTKLNDALRIFWYHTKGQSLWYSDTNSGWWATPLPSEIYAESGPSPLRKMPISTDFRLYRLNCKRYRKKFNYDGYKSENFLQQSCSTTIPVSNGL